MDKAALRTEMKARRQALDPRARALADGKIREVLRTRFGVKNRFFFYYPVRGEADLLPFAADVLAAGGAAVFPALGLRGMQYRAVKDLDKDLSREKYGIRQPGMGSPVVKRFDEDDILFVPGLAFAPDGARLGYGGGYFDRFLPAFPGFAVGVCYAFQVLDGVPRARHDVPVQFLCTEDGLVRCAAPAAGVGA